MIEKQPPDPICIREMPEQRGKVVLVVDDFNQFSESIRETLTRRRFEILCAKSPKKGLVMFQARRSNIDLVIIDMATPAASNLELAAELERLPGPSILYIVGGGKSVARCSIEAYAPDSVLVAPFTQEQLIERVGVLLGIEVTARRSAEEETWERLMAASHPIPTGPAILHVYQLRQARLAVDHTARLHAGEIHHSIRPTNCHEAPYGMIVAAVDLARAQSLLAQATAGRQLVTAA